MNQVELHTGDAEDVGHVSTDPGGGPVETNETCIDSHVGTLLPHSADVTRAHPRDQRH